MDDSMLLYHDDRSSMALGDERFRQDIASARNRSSLHVALNAS